MQKQTTDLLNAPLDNVPKTKPLLKIKTMENNKSVTAVEWLVEQLCIEHRVSLVEKAKEMEREQIKNAFTNGDCNGTFETINAEQYYNETFGK